MIPISIRVVAIPPGQERKAYWRGAPWRNLVEQCAADMGDAARDNVIKFGGPGGAWKQLSGYNENRNRQRRSKRILAGKMRAGELQGDEFISAGWHRRRARQRIIGSRGIRAGAVGEADLAYAASPHLGYARTISLGQDPGHGQFGPDVRLRRTGAFFASLRGKARYESDRAVIRLAAQGREGSRPANQQLLEWFVHGTRTMPARNPAQDMRLYEARVLQRIRKFLDAAPH